jgi:hypothetical protein
MARGILQAAVLNFSKYSLIDKLCESAVLRMGSKLAIPSLNHCYLSS